VRPVDELFHWPLAAALAFALGAALYLLSPALPTLRQAGPAVSR
jgi:hypothetical protein